MVLRVSSSRIHRVWVACRRDGPFGTVYYPRRFALRIKTRIRVYQYVFYRRRDYFVFRGEHNEYASRGLERGNVQAL